MRFAHDNPDHPDMSHEGIAAALPDRYLPIQRCESAHPYLPMVCSRPKGHPRNHRCRQERWEGEVIENYSLDWEDGFSVVTGYRLNSRSHAFATMDQMFRDAEYPGSLRIVLRRNGTIFWAQMGTSIEYSGV